MKLQSWLGLPWKLRDVIRSMRRDLADSRRMMDELARMASAAEIRHEALSREFSAVRENLLGEIREQGLLTETAARFSIRAAAERKLREQLATPACREPGLSVLITCWNHAGFLRHAVASATATLETLLVPGEVLILDDASRDGSRGVAQELAQADQRIRLILSDENLGLPRARNVLLSQAGYKHAMILDSDNQLVPSGVATLYSAARQIGAVHAYGNVLRIDERGSVLGVFSNERATANLRESNWIDAMALVQTERLIELGGYECEWLYGMEDWELNLRLFSLCEPMVFVPVLAGKYRTSSQSMISEAPSATRRRRASRMFGRLEASEPTNHHTSIHHPAIGEIWPRNGEASPGSQDSLWAISPPAPSGPRILVVTSAGVQNYGDDAILLSTLERLRRIRPGSLAAVVSDGPDCPPLGRLGTWAGTCEEFGSGLDRTDVLRGCRDNPALVEQMSRWVTFGSRPGIDVRLFDVVLIAGGGNLNCHWPDLTARRAAIAAAANAANIPYILSGQGVGPVSAEVTPTISYLVGGASAVATRDPLSLRILRKMVPDHPRIDMVGDDALGIRCDGPTVARRHLSEIGVPIDRPLLGFQAREANYVGFSRDDLRETARLVDDFAAENNHVVLCVPINMQSHAPEVELLADLAYGSSRSAEWHIVNHAGNVAAIAGAIKVCDALLTHSYHAALFALENRIPALLYARTEYYQLKAESLRTAFGIPVPLVRLPGIQDVGIADQLESLSQASWTRGMTSAHVDTWLDELLPQVGQWRNGKSSGGPLHTRMKSAGSSAA